MNLFSTVKAKTLSGLFLLAVFSISSPADAAERIRGAVTSFDGHLLQVKTRDGREATLSITDSTTISSMVACKMSDIKKGSFVGVTAVPSDSNDWLVAREVHIFPEAQRGTGEGHYDWDLEPGATMTNANVEATVTYRKGKELVLGYKGGSQKIMVPIGVPIVTFKPGDKSLLKNGAQVFVIAQAAADGSLSALRISVGKNGVRPPM